MSTGKPFTTKETYNYALRDGTGEVIFKSGSRVTTFVDANGNEHVVSEYESIVTVDGIEWSRPMLKANPPVLLAVCAACRKPPQRGGKRSAPPTHGLCTARNAVYCVKCAAVCCPAHAHWAGDAYRCPDCHRRHRRKMFFKSLFFARVPEED